MEKVWKWQLLLQWGSLVLLVAERDGKGVLPKETQTSQEGPHADTSFDPTVGENAEKNHMSLAVFGLRKFAGFSTLVWRTAKCAEARGMGEGIACHRQLHRLRHGHLLLERSLLGWYRSTLCHTVSFSIISPLSVTTRDLRELDAETHVLQRAAVVSWPRVALVLR